MPNTTTGIRRFEGGGIFTLNDGTTTWTGKVIEPGTMFWTPGMYEPLTYTDRGEQQFPYEGDEQLSEWGVDFKYCGAQATDDVAKFMLARQTSTGLMKNWTAVIKNPTVKDGATGEQITWANSFLDKIEIKAGAKFDMISLKMKSTEPYPAVTTY